jgi:DNA-binding CsgD family transcriptional regulator
MSRYPQLVRDSLARLRTLARAIHEGDRSAVPLGHLLRLAGEVGIDAGVTIDLEASRDLGQPLIILRLPAEEHRDPRLAGLSRREREVAGLLAEGLSNKQVARRLAITLATVKDHVHRILRKTGLPNRTAIATAWKGVLARTPPDPGPTV